MPPAVTEPFPDVELVEAEELVLLEQPVVVVLTLQIELEVFALLDSWLVLQSMPFHMVSSVAGAAMVFFVSKAPEADVHVVLLQESH